jgi:hypothetical protein
MPDEGEEDSLAVEAIRRHRDRPWLIVGIGLLALGALLALSNADVWPDPGNLWLAATLAGAGIVWWQVAGKERSPSRLAVAVLGIVFVVASAGLAAAAFEIWGDGDWRPAFALAGLAAGAAIGLGAAAGRVFGVVVAFAVLVAAFSALALAAQIPFSGGVGDRTERPLGVAALDDDYELAVGDLTVDLRALRLPPGRTEVDARVGIGELEVIVPRGVALEATGRARAGKVNVLGREESGTQSRETVVTGPAHARSVLVVDARVGLGDVRIHRP